MTIDQTRSFFINSDGASTSYYDPNVKSTSETRFSSQTNGVSFGMGTLANAFGIGGIAGSLLGGLGLNSSSTSGNALTSTTYFKEYQPYKFSEHISYSFDNGETYDRISTNFYSGSLIEIPVKKKQVNNAFRETYIQKSDALSEPAFTFNIEDNITSNDRAKFLIYDSYAHGALIDYK